MGKALYRSYRSTSFDEVLGQDHITTTLKNAIKNGHINHAYLLTGPRGVGKTSVARILAHAVNGLEYSHDHQHMDIIEIDAASNRRIDEIRELRERVMVAPTSAKYKVYIVDEVHMLTREAFNALLKTLEEPPAHVIFILATTEFHKLPDTIVSRCLRFNFRVIEPETATSHLERIAQKEKISIEPAALELIANHGNGSFRDSISMLDQIRNMGDTITLNNVQRMLGSAPEDMIKEVVHGIAAGTPAELLKSLTVLYDYGATAGEIAKQLSTSLRAQLLVGELPLNSDATLRLMRELLAVQAAPQPKAQLELVLLETVLDQTPIASMIPKDVKAQNVPQPQVSNTPSSVALADTLVPGFKNNPAISKVTTPKVKTQDTKDQKWLSILAALKAKNNTLYSIARMANTTFMDDKLILTFKFAFHHKQISEPKNKNLIVDVVRASHPAIADIEIRLEPNANTETKPHPVTPKSDDPSFSSITNIFGGGEVLES